MDINPSRDIIEFQQQGQWRDWLMQNCGRLEEAWLLIYKKRYQNMGLSLNQAVEEALCFGWIDSTLKPIDERCYALRFSPRRQDSVWSIRNIQRVEKLQKAGKMMAPGQDAVTHAQKSGAWLQALRREQVDCIPSDLETVLKERDGALSAYQALPDSRKKRFIYWLQTAKHDDTRRRRIERIVDEILDK